MKRLAISFFAQPFVLPYQKMKFKLDEKVLIHTHGMHLLSRHIPSKFCVPLGLDHLLQIYRVIHKSLWDFQTRPRNNQDRHGRKEHIDR